jgi:hypothetical protein
LRHFAGSPGGASGGRVGGVDPYASLRSHRR